MARETKLLISIPGDLNKDLAEYLFKLQDVGVNISKCVAVIRLAQIGVRQELNALVNNESGTV